MKSLKRQTIPKEIFYEYHKTHYETPEIAETSVAFLESYETHLQNYTLQGDSFQAYDIKESHYKTINYKISLQCCGYTLTDHQLILQCTSLHRSFCRQCRLC